MLTCAIKSFDLIIIISSLFPNLEAHNFEFVMPLWLRKSLSFIIQENL